MKDSAKNPDRLNAPSMSGEAWSRFMNLAEEVACEGDEAQAKALIQAFVDQHGPLGQDLWETLSDASIHENSSTGLRAIASIASLSDRRFFHADYDPVREAVRRVAPEALEALLKMGCDASRRSQDGLTPIRELVEEQSLFWPGNDTTDDALECLDLLWERAEAKSRGSAKEAALLEEAVLSINEEPFNRLMELGGAQMASTRPGPLLEAALDSDEWAIDRLASLATVLPKSIWSEKAIIRKAAQKCNLEAVEWMIQERLGLDNKNAVSHAIVALVIGHGQVSENILSAVERLLPHADLFDAKPRKSGAKTTVLAAFLPRAFGAHSDHWLPLVDLIAAFDPRQIGAKEVWERFGATPEKIPRLSARVEAEILRQALADSRPSSSARATREADLAHPQDAKGASQGLSAERAAARRL